MAVAPVPPRGYRPALDGIRAVAILMVVADHVWHEPPIALGPTGVTLFFALSGYLITGILVDEHTRTGRVSFRRFYLRRTARLIPGLLLVVVVCNLLFLLVRDLASVKASVYALAYVANYATIWRDAYLPGWGQTWSLAVEEHFYLVWPVVLLLLLTRGRLRTALWWVLVGCAGAVAWRLALLSLDGVDAGSLVIYHGTLARADALLYGCAAAVAVRLGYRLPSWVVWPAVVVIAAMTVLTGATVLFATLGQALLSLAAAALVMAVDTTTTPLRRALSPRPLVYVGVISYGLYLWHYPLIYVAYGLGIGETLWGRALFGVVLTTVAAAAAFRWVERPAKQLARDHEDQLVDRLGRMARRPVERGA